MEKAHSRKWQTVALVPLFLFGSNIRAATFSTTTTEDKRAPVISNLQVLKVQGDKAIVSWDTDEIADSNIKFNASGSKNVKVSGDLNYSLKHNIVLTRLSPLTNYAITIGSTDPSGNSSTATSTFDTPNNINVAPLISGTPQTFISVGRTYQFTPKATDNDTDTLTFEILNKPSWAEFDTANGTLSGVPLISHKGTYSNIIISVSDGAALTSLAKFSINVGNISVAENTNGSSNISAAFNDESGNTFLNTVNTVVGSTMTNTSEGTILQVSVANAIQQVALFNDGKTASTLNFSNGRGNNYQSTISCQLVGTEVNMLETGDIEFQVSSSDGSKISAKQKPNGSMSQSISSIDSNGIGRTTKISTTHPRSSLDISADGSTTVNIVYTSKVINSSGLAIYLKSTTMITATASGEVTITTKQSGQLSGVEKTLKTFSIKQLLKAGTTVTVEDNKILVRNISDTKVGF